MHYHHFLIYCSTPSDLSFLIHPPELSGKYQQRHLVVERGETLRETAVNFAEKYLFLIHADTYQDFTLFCRYLNVSLDSRLQQDMWNVMSSLAKCQYPFYFRMQRHLKPIRNILPQFAQLNVSHFMLQVAYVSDPSEPSA
jgi:hypothetical protein